MGPCLYNHAVGHPEKGVWGERNGTYSVNRSPPAQETSVRPLSNIREGVRPTMWRLGRIGDLLGVSRLWEGSSYLPHHIPLSILLVLCKESLLVAVSTAAVGWGAWPQPPTGALKLERERNSPPGHRQLVFWAISNGFGPLTYIHTLPSSHLVRSTRGRVGTP